jgi:Ca2+/H+ antiporter
VFPALDGAEGATHKLGEPRGDCILLLLALAIDNVSVGNGRTSMLANIVHLVVFVAILLLIAVPEQPFSTSWG